jgi:hypothetical protein
MDSSPTRGAAVVVPSKAGDGHHLGATAQKKGKKKKKNF